MSECVYCTRPFCELHGERGEDYTHVCAGRRCRAKLEDLREQTEWRARVKGSNRRNECAIEGCPQRVRRQCSRCRLLFCEEHVRPRDIRDRSLTNTLDKMIQGRALLTAASLPAGRPEQLLPPDARPALVCTHCATRRKTSN